MIPENDLQKFDEITETIVKFIRNNMNRALSFDNILHNLPTESANDIGVAINFAVQDGKLYITKDYDIGVTT